MTAPALPPKEPRVCRKCGKTTTEWQFSGPYSAPDVIDVICMDCWAKWARGSAKRDIAQTLTPEQKAALREGPAQPDESEWLSIDLVTKRDLVFVLAFVLLGAAWVVMLLAIVAITSCAPYTPPRPKPNPPISGCIALCGSPCPPTVHCEHCAAMVDADEWPVSEARYDCEDWNDH